MRCTENRTRKCLSFPTVMSSRADPIATTGGLPGSAFMLVDTVVRVLV